MKFPQKLGKRFISIIFLNLIYLLKKYGYLRDVLGANAKGTRQNVYNVCANLEIDRYAVQTLV